MNENFKLERNCILLQLWDYMKIFPLLSFQYEYKYEVKDPEKMLFFDKNEAGDAQGKVIKKIRLVKEKVIVIMLHSQLSNAN